jgi:hypothetical protein
MNSAHAEKCGEPAAAAKSGRAGYNPGLAAEHVDANEMCRFKAPRMNGLEAL